MAKSKRKVFIQKLGDDISSEVGNLDDLSTQIEQDFYKTLHDNLDHFNSSNFDNDGFVKRMSNMSIPEDIAAGNSTIKDILSILKNDNVGVNDLNNTEMLVKRDIDDIIRQMPQMADVIDLSRDAIVEADVVSGEIARSLKFENLSKDDASLAKVKAIEKRYDLHRVIRNFIVPHAMKGGEYYINIISYKKIFSELEFISKNSYRRESADIEKEFLRKSSISNPDNVKAIMESVSDSAFNEIEEKYTIGTDDKKKYTKETRMNEMTKLLERVNVYSEHNSVLSQELGLYGLKELMEVSCEGMKSETAGKTFFESMMMDLEDEKDNYVTHNYDFVKGSYIKYLDPLRVIPVRLDTKIVGYCYASTVTDNQLNQAQPNGILDVSFQSYTKSQTVVKSLADVIIRSFDKKMLERNMNLKSDIADIIMAHKFEKGKLSFIYIPENEIVRFSVNEDENGKGHSIVERSMFPARTYIILTLYNLLYTLNNTTTRIHYLKTSGLNKNIAASVQSLMRKFQSRRITIDDVFSYSGVLNKVGGMGELVLPAGKGDQKAFETDTIPATTNPIDLDYIESKKKEAISSSGVPALMATNAIDEVEFAKTLELANARFLSLISSLKLQFNIDITKLYKILLRNDTDIDINDINTFIFKFNDVKQQSLNITATMISDFNALYDLLLNTVLDSEEVQDKDGKPSPLALKLKRELLYEYLPQVEVDRLLSLLDKLRLEVVDEELKHRDNTENISDEELETVK